MEVFEQFHIVKAPVMQQGLADKYPMMRAYAGKGIQDPTAYLRFDITQKGFHGMILTGKSSSIFIDPYAVGNTEHYISYYKKDFKKATAVPFSCQTEHKDFNKEDQLLPPVFTPVAGDCMLRTYRTAIAVTGEYSNYHGGNVPDVLAAVVTSLTRINGVYERDHGITMVLVENNDLLMFLNAATDPFGNGNDITANQTTLDNTIGFDNYDIGHLFVEDGGGFAPGTPCTSSKAGGLSGIFPPVGDPFDIDYVCHEMGHQYGANHTQNNSCARVAATAMEPGSASTIMGYAGICAPNVQFNSDDHFHAISIQEIAEEITTGQSSTCPLTEDTGNNAPVVDGGLDYNLPVSTPFRLTAFGTDIDGDSLTYCWEQMDNEVAPMPPVSTSDGGPAFRSISPVNSPTRYFPALQWLTQNVDPEWEELPGVSRNMNFRVTVRDNNLGHGCTGEDDVELTFVENAGPFEVLNPNTSVTWLVGDFATIEWDVANTDAAPVSCSEVDIYLSTDGGMTYAILLASAVPNNGSLLIEVPDTIGTTNRIMVICANNIFFDISNQNFEIQAPPEPGIALNISPVAINTCAQTAPIELTINLNSLAGFSEEVNLSVSGLPADIVATIDPANPITPPATATLTITNPELLPIGNTSFTINAMAVSADASISGSITINPDITASASLVSPANNEFNVATATQLEWSAVPDATSYNIEIATNPSFDAGSIIEAAEVLVNNYSPQNLDLFTVYYWRVFASNLCGDGPASEFFGFQTFKPECITFESTDVPLEIPSSETGVWTSGLTIAEDLNIQDVNVYLDMEHTWVGDLIIGLTAPNGSTFALLDQPGIPGSNFGCGENNLQIVFDDDAVNTAGDLEDECNPGGLAISGVYQSIDPLNSLIGQSSQGNWTLSVEDVFNQDGGEVVSWSVEICSEAEPATEILLSNQVIVVPKGDFEVITNTYLQATSLGGDPITYSYVIISLPQNGTLFINGSIAVIGMTFSQADIDNNMIVYQHDGSDTDSDSFHFEVVNSEGTWSNQNIFNIIIFDESLTATLLLDMGIDCFGEATGQVTANAFGGTEPVEYSIDGLTFQTDPVFANLPAGTYTVTVADGTGATTTTNSITINQPDEIIVNFTQDFNNISVTADGGTGALEFSIDGTNFQSSGNFEALPNGDHTIFVSDQNGCIGTAMVTVFVNTLDVSAAITAGITCVGASDGQITVSVSGGTPPYQYSIDNGATYQDSEVFTGLDVGGYIVTVLDTDGFTLNTPGVILGNPPALNVSTTIVENDLTVEATGGTGDYQYSIDGVNFQAGNSFPDLPNGDYTVYVVDENGCTETVDITINFSTVSDLDKALLFEVIPNPTTGVFTVRLQQNSTLPYRLTIFDSIGKLLYQDEFSNLTGIFERSFDFSHFTGGVYVLQVANGIELASKRLILIK